MVGTFACSAATALASRKLVVPWIAPLPTAARGSRAGTWPVESFSSRLLYPLPVKGEAGILKQTARRQFPGWGGEGVREKMGRSPAQGSWGGAGGRALGWKSNA